jgi:hypothetical protein
MTGLPSREAASPQIGAPPPDAVVGDVAERPEPWKSAQQKYSMNIDICRNNG